MKFFINKGDGFGYAIYINNNSNLVATETLCGKSMKNEKVLLENCLCFDGDQKEKNICAITAANKNGELFFITFSEGNAKKIKFSDSPERIIFESLKILCLKNQSIITLCIEEETCFAHICFSVSQGIAKERRLIFKSKEFCPCIYFSKNQENSIEFVFKCKNKFNRYIYDEKEITKTASFSFSKNETKDEFFIIKGEKLRGIYKQNNLLFFFEGVFEKESFIFQNTALTKKHLKNHQKPILIEENENLWTVVWQGDNKLFKAQKTNQISRWSKISEFETEENFEIAKICCNGKSRKILVSENQFFGFNETENLVRILIKHEKEIKALNKKLNLT